MGNIRARYAITQRGKIKQMQGSRTGSRHRRRREVEEKRKKEKGKTKGSTGDAFVFHLELRDN